MLSLLYGIAYIIEIYIIKYILKIYLIQYKKLYLVSGLKLLRLICATASALTLKGLDWLKIT